MRRRNVRFAILDQEHIVFCPVGTYFVKLAVFAVKTVAIAVIHVASLLRNSFEYICKMKELKQTDTEREENTAKSISNCIKSFLRFWRVCRKKKKTL